MQLRKKRGIKRKANVYESEDDNEESPSQNRLKPSCSKRLLSALECDNDAK